MARDLGLLTTGIVVAVAALVMGSTLNYGYQSGFASTPETSYVSSEPTLKHYYRPGAGIATEFSMVADYRN
ncbi:MAG TPA: hypothetical protein V6C76_04630 [Drouetiella sp.]